MTQRIFKATDPNDIKELFDLFNDYVDSIEKDDDGTSKCFDDKGQYRWRIPINISWGDLTEIHRPVDHEKYIGKLGVFCNGDMRQNDVIGVLDKVEDGVFHVRNRMIYESNTNWYDNFRPLTQQEAKDLIG